MTRAELIEALKSAKGPNVKLDGFIVEACGGARNKNSIHPHRAFGRMPGDDGEGYYCLPELTASLDAAISLVERVRPDADWRIESFSKYFIAEVDGVSTDDNNGPPYYPATPALALLIALLESMEADQSGYAKEAK